MAILINNILKAIVFGESHGSAIGVTLSGFPCGIEIDEKYIAAKLQQRKAKASSFSTSRIEEDNFEIISGVYNNKTTGEPITAICRNQNIKNSDYNSLKDLYRPSHADYTADKRFKGNTDPRGGGHFSGRLTAAMVFAGALSELALLKHNITIYSHLKKIKNITDRDIAKASNEELDLIKSNTLPVIDKEIIPDLEKLFNDYKLNNDSLGGIVETAVKNVKPGIGNTHAQSLESRISSAMFAIPAVKGIEFGLGFDFATSSGSTANDEIQIKNYKISTLSNNNGGIIGGITNGEDIIFRVAFKCVPSIAQPQNTVNKSILSNEKIIIKGRHDVCFVPRTIPIVDGMVALTILDAYLEAYGYEGY